MHVASPSLLPGKDNTPQLGSRPSWSFSTQHQGDAQLPCEHPRVPTGAPHCTRDAAVVPRAGAADVCSQDAREKKHLSSAHNQPEPGPPEITIVMSQCMDVPKHEGFCLEDAAKAFTSGCEMHSVPITSRGARACYFHHRMFSVGTFSCQPGETSHWRQLEPPNGFFFTSPCARAAPSLADEHQRVSPMLNSNKSNCLENT